VTTLLTLRSTLLVTFGVLLSKTAAFPLSSVRLLICFGRELMYLDHEADTARRGLSDGPMASSPPQQW
jgi:hypothetical protein